MVFRNNCCKSYLLKQHVQQKIEKGINNWQKITFGKKCAENNGGNGGMSDVKAVNDI